MSLSVKESKWTATVTAKRSPSLLGRTFSPSSALELDSRCSLVFRRHISFFLFLFSLRLSEMFAEPLAYVPQGDFHDFSEAEAVANESMYLLLDNLSKLKKDSYGTNTSSVDTLFSGLNWLKGISKQTQRKSHSTLMMIASLWDEFLDKESTLGYKEVCQKVESEHHLRVCRPH